MTFVELGFLREKLIEEAYAEAKALDFNSEAEREQFLSGKVEGIITFYFHSLHFWLDSDDKTFEAFKKSA